jgi:hypothetical protein
VHKNTLDTNDCADMSKWLNFISMQTILDIATLLGGISALVFFWDRFIPRIVQIHKGKIDKILHFDKSKSLVLQDSEKIGAIFGSLSGIILTILALFYPLHELIIFTPLGLILIFIGSSMNKYKSVKTPTLIHIHFVRVLQSVGLFIFVWSFFGLVFLFGFWKLCTILYVLVVNIFFGDIIDSFVTGLLFFISFPTTLIFGAWLGSIMGSEV